MAFLRLFVTAAVSVLLINLSILPSAASTGLSQEHRVNMRIFFRAFCPACQWFILDPLVKLIRMEEYFNIIDLTLIPAARMNVMTDNTITCESGLLECTGHRWMVCVLDKDRDDVVKYLGTIACIESDESGQMGDWSTKMNKCMTDTERFVVKECFDKRSTDLLIKMIREEQPESVPWMPYMLVNQKELGSLLEGVSLEMLKTSICSAYTGPESFYPVECVKLVGKQTKFTSDDTAGVKEIELPVATGEHLAATTAHNEEAVITAAKPLDIKAGNSSIVVATTFDPIRAPDTAQTLDKVQLEMYWRASCPGCKSFITKSLLSLVQDKGFLEIIDFHPVPAAGTYYDAAGTAQCIGGRFECSGQKWLSCAVKEIQQMQGRVERFACMERKDNKGMTWKAIIKRCFSGNALKKMRTCYAAESDELLRAHVVKSKALRIPWVPYVLLNGVPLGDAKHGIGSRQFMDAICKAYSGPQNLRPASCQPKQLRHEVESLPLAQEEAVKPCAPTTKDNSADAQYDDAPGIGKPLTSERDAIAVTEFEAKVANGRQADEEKSSATMIAVLLPGVCFVVLVVVALRLTRDHKKDA